MDAIGKFFTGLILLIITAVIGGFIMIKFWSWFVLPVFFLPSLSLIQAIGFNFFLSWIFYQKRDKKKDYNFSKFMEDFFDSLLSSAAVFFIGWLIHLLY